MNNQKTYDIFFDLDIGQWLHGFSIWEATFNYTDNNDFEWQDQGEKLLFQIIKAADKLMPVLENEKWLSIVEIKRIAFALSRVKFIFSEQFWIKPGTKTIDYIDYFDFNKIKFIKLPGFQKAFEYTEYNIRALGEGHSGYIDRTTEIFGLYGALIKTTKLVTLFHEIFHQVDYLYRPVDRELTELEIDRLASIFVELTLIGGQDE